VTRPYVPAAELQFDGAWHALRERLALKGHGGAVRSPDGKRIVTASKDGELRCVIARYRSPGRIAAYLGLQFREIGEDVGLAPQLIGNHRRPGGNARNHGDTNTVALHRLHERAEIAVTREQHHLVDALGELHGIDRELYVHVASDLATTTSVDKFLSRFGHDSETVIVKPIDQGAERRIFLILGDRRVVECSEQRSTALKLLEQAFVVDIKAERLRRCVEIGAVDKDRDLVGLGANLNKKLCVV